MAWRLWVIASLLSECDCSNGDRSCVAGVCKANANGTYLLQTRKKSSVVSGAADGVKNPPWCDNLAKSDCEESVLCDWGVAMGKCHAKIAWLHIKKTGGSFGTTLAHYANSSLPEEAKIIYVTEMMGDAILNYCYEYPVDVWFKDVFWQDPTQGGCNSGDHAPIVDTAWQEWKGRFFSMIRQPEELAVSAFNYFIENGTEDIVDISRKKWGMQTRMLSGGSEGIFKSNAHGAVAIAVERLQTGFAFVGLTGEWDLSICLFHRMFGGECLPVEFENMRPSNYSSDDTKEMQLQMLLADPDPYDNEVYKIASEIFWSNVRKYDVRRSTCLETCSAVAHIFQASVGDNSSGTLLIREHAGDDQDFEYKWPGRYVYRDV